MHQQENLLAEIDPSSSILLLGSGFSIGATNIDNESPPNGSGLKRHFIKQLGFPQDSAYDLQVLTEEFSEDNPGRLYQELYKLFRIRGLNKWQEAVLDEPWQRIYTTNYDDVVEFHRIAKKTPVNSYNVSEDIPRKLPTGSVVHLHGSIRQTSPDDVLNSLVLGEASYVNQYLQNSPWYDQFQRDIAFASNLYIIGYSLSDYHIAALLLQNPELAARTIFIQGPNPDAVFLRRTQNYGQTQFIGTQGFAEALKTARRPDTPNIHMLRSFRPLSPNRDNRPIAQPTAPEIYDLLVYGDFHPARLAASQPNETYAIGRAHKVIEAADSIERNAALVIDGRLGNGKTIFLNLLAFELEKRGWTCVLFKPGNANVEKELATLRGTGRIIVFIDNYLASQDAIGGLREALPDAKFVVEIRSGTFEVRYHEIADVLPKPFDRKSVNSLSRPEVESFSTLCGSAGLPKPASTSAVDLRDLLLELFNNKSIRDRIQSSLSPLFENVETRRILIMTMLTATYQGSVGTGFIRTVIGADPFVALKGIQHLSNEVFEVSADSFKARSSVFSSYVINSFVAVRELADCIVDLTLAAAGRRSERPYRVLMSNMMAFSNLNRALRYRNDSLQTIIEIYERLRHDERVNAEPLFWLQYAIAMSEKPKLDAAEDYIDNAYRKAAASPGFQTYQIDTQAFRISLLRGISEPIGQPVANIDKIISGLERINIMLSEASHRAYAVRVLEGVKPFVTARRRDLSQGERTALQFWVGTVSKSLAELTDEFKMTSGSEQVRGTIQEAAALLAS